MRQLTRKEMLAAEVFGYSYANYQNHLGIGNIRFEQLMPDAVDTLERAEQEDWDSFRIAQAIDIEEGKVELWQRLYREAKEIVDAPTSAESFRRGVRVSIRYAVEKGLADETSIERLVTQICYRVADFGYLLDLDKQQLSYYSKHLREETEPDLEALDLGFDPGQE